jgi:hypothetical protein
VFGSIRRLRHLVQIILLCNLFLLYGAFGSIRRYVPTHLCILGHGGTILGHGSPPHMAHMYPPPLCILGHGGAILRHTALCALTDAQSKRPTIEAKETYNRVKRDLL